MVESSQHGRKKEKRQKEEMHFLDEIRGSVAKVRFVPPLCGNRKCKVNALKRINIPFKKEKKY